MVKLGKKVGHPRPSDKCRQISKRCAEEMCIVRKEKVAIRVIKAEQLPHTNTHLDTKT